MTHYILLNFCFLAQNPEVWVNLQELSPYAQCGQTNNVVDGIELH